MGVTLFYFFSTPERLDKSNIHFANKCRKIQIKGLLSNFSPR